MFYPCPLFSVPVHSKNWASGIFKKALWKHLKKIFLKNNCKHGDEVKECECEDEEYLYPYTTIWYLLTRGRWFSVDVCVGTHIWKKPKLWSSPIASPGSQLTVWTSSLPLWRTIQLGSIWDVPFGSKGIIWNRRKSVSLMWTFSGQTSSMSLTLSLSKSSLHASPRPSPGKK